MRYTSSACAPRNPVPAITSGRTSTGGIIKREAVLSRQPHRELHQAELQQRAVRR